MLYCCAMRRQSAYPEPFTKQAASMSGVRVHRMSANSTVSPKEYHEVFAHVYGRVGKPIDDLLGPDFRDMPWQVTPDYIVRSIVLLEPLIDAGVKTGILYPLRFENGLKDAHAANSKILRAIDNAVPLTITNLRIHISTILASCGPGSGRSIALLHPRRRVRGAIRRQAL